MTIFLILVLIAVQIVSYVIIGFIVREHRITTLEMTEKITATYLAKLESETQSAAKMDKEMVDPTELEELSDEEILAFRFPTNQPKETGDIDE